jgi:hypothetical protein
MKLQILIVSTILLINSPEGMISSGPVSSNKTVSAPVNPAFTFFRTHRQTKDGITATWGISSMDGVMFFTVQRTYEDPTDQYAYWENLCNVPCNGTRSFKHTDNNVFPGFINYRVVAYMIDGSTVASEVSTVRIVAH